MTALATRRERVILDLEDNLTPGLARAAVAARALDKSLDHLGGTSTDAGDDLDVAAGGADHLGSSSRKAGPDIDRFSGRLGLLVRVAAVLGPALVPLGAATIPVLTGSLAALGSAAGGLGATILAFNGLGDAMKAIDEFQAERTAENLQAMRVELEKLGPAGADFARYLQSIAPEMTELQMIARQGMFPGMQEGIESLMTRLPEVQSIIGRLSRGVGELASSAGADLASDDWQPFFDYVEQTARPTLERFGNTIGNVAQGLADMLVAFAPVTRDFSRGMLEMSESFADWAAGLKDNETFQDFIDYIRQSGPQALDLLGSISDAFVAIVKAAAPVGAVTLPILTAIANIFAAIASSPIGAPLLTAAIALGSLGTAAKFAAVPLAKIPLSMAAIRTSLTGANFRTAAAGLGLVALAATDVDEKIGLSNTAMLGAAGLVAGPWGAGIGAAIGLTLDYRDASNDLASAVDETTAAIERGRLAEIVAARAKLENQIATEHVSARNIGLGSALDWVAGKWHDATGETDAARAKIEEADAAAVAAGHGFTLFGNHVNTAALELAVASRNAQDLSASLSELAGWLDKREALRNYADSIKALGKGLKDGFGPEDLDNINAFGRGIIQVAESIKSDKVRSRWLAGVRADLEALSEKSGPKAQAALQKLINKLEDLGLTNAEPDVKVDTRKALGDLNRLIGVLNVFDGKVATARVVTIYERLNAPGGPGSKRPGNTDQLFGDTGGGGGGSGGGDDEDSRIAFPTSGRGNLAAQNALKGASTSGGSGGHSNVPAAANDTSTALERLRQHLNASRTALEKETRQRDNLRQKAADIRSGVTSGLTNDLWSSSGDVWSAGGGTMNPFQALADRKDQARRMIAAIRALRKKGITGAALSEILNNGGLAAAEYMAALSGSALMGFQADYASTQHLISQAAQVGVNASGFASDAAALNPSIKELNQTVKRLEKKLEKMSENHKKANKENSDDNAQQVGKQVNGAARHGRARVYS